MNRWLMIASLVATLTTMTGCLHHQTRGGCSTGDCSSGSCGECSSGGLLGKLSGKSCGSCGTCNGCRTGCVAGSLGWQQGGLDYSSHLQPGLLGHRAAASMESVPFQPGPPTGQVAYPYYTHRGPRDFLMDNPPSIGR
ncbi:MAG: hypothetical protein AAGA03_15450 [Planctomycetota bacterium]